jgi:hypothetical protein
MSGKEEIRIQYYLCHVKRGEKFPNKCTLTNFGGTLQQGLAGFFYRL